MVVRERIVPRQSVRMAPRRSVPSVVVVGAGPAGSTAARLLAASGARVTLVEARRLPRPKLCGGGLTPKAQRLLPPRALATVERRVDTVELRGSWLPPFRVTSGEATIAMVERGRFDLALVEDAAAAGVEVRDGEPVLDAGEDDEAVWIETARERLVADVLVAADGEPSRIARRLGLASDAKRLALGLEVDTPYPASVPADTAIVSFAVPAGYAWYFPKGDHANVGVASARSDRRRRLGADLARFAATIGVDLAGRHVRGHWIPIGLRRGRLASRRVVLVGDAAATTDPLFGEGIAYALYSAHMAAWVVRDWGEGAIPDLGAHDARLRAGLGPAFARLGEIARFAEFSATAALFALRASVAARDAAVDAVTGRRAPFALRAG